ncbi:methyltransferase domain-containing protein [Defluviitalea raffinosedens]|uniref:Methyltransferase domain-containing protein n=1 Tax=Defluviitalea raffinosedens TaxID=1450156 RepID=A0A7C8HDI7_9FIRM|nr:methyltransferase domain-containing protein [Defluviitalea raffinosedens]
MNKVDAKEKTRRHFNETADHYVDSHDGKFVQHMYTSLLKELEKFTSGKLLDIGCGNGDFLGLIKDRGLELHGIDLAENMVKVAKKRYGDIAQIILGVRKIFHMRRVCLMLLSVMHHFIIILIREQYLLR